MWYCPTTTLHLNLALTGDGAFLLSPPKTHTVWFISILNYGDTENVLINHLLLVIPMLYLCHYTNLCPHKPHKHAHTHTLTHTHTHTHTLLPFDVSLFWSCFVLPCWPFYLLKISLTWIWTQSSVHMLFSLTSQWQLLPFWVVKFGHTFNLRSNFRSLLPR